MSSVFFFFSIFFSFLHNFSLKKCYLAQKLCTSFFCHAFWQLNIVSTCFACLKKKQNNFMNLAWVFLYRVMNELLYLRDWKKSVLLLLSVLPFALAFIKWFFFSHLVKLHHFLNRTKKTKKPKKTMIHSLARACLLYSENRPKE